MKTTRTILYFFVGLVALSSVFLLFSYAYTGYESLSAQTTQTRLGELEARAGKLDETYREWQNFPKLFSDFKNHYLMRTAQFAQFRQELLTICTRHGLSYQDLRTDPYSVFPDVIRVRFSVTFSGAYHGVKNLLFDMSNRPEMIVFKRVTLATGKNPGFVDGSIVMEVYFGK